MTLADLPLGYCMNVHPMQSIEAVEQAMVRYTEPIMRRIGRPMAAGLWLSHRVVTEVLESPGGLERLVDALDERGLSCHTLNAFPFGQFHGQRVKEQVYLPDWADEERLDYTLGCAGVLARLLGGVEEGSISTVPLGFKPQCRADDFIERCVSQLLEAARELDWLRLNTGKTIRLAIEPEPFCVLETTQETVSFFERLFAAGDRASIGPAVRRHIGLCYDVCHQAVEFEDIADSIRRIHASGIRINKVHITAALQVDQPGRNADARQELARYVEPRYLHQATGRLSDGSIVRCLDLNEAMCRSPEGGFERAECWRVHFHAPVDADSLGVLGTTRPAILEAIWAVSRLPYAPHLEVETYTWGVMPLEAPVDLIEAIAREMEWAQTRIDAIRGGTADPGSGE